MRAWLRLERERVHRLAARQRSVPVACLRRLRRFWPPPLVIARVPVARRTRLKIDLAGSHASAEAAATASADFDIRVDGVSSATMRFAAAATSATFIAATETVLEPGQVLSVVAPSTPDATLAGIGFTLAGTLVL